MNNNKDTITCSICRKEIPFEIIEDGTNSVTICDICGNAFCDKHDTNSNDTCPVCSGKGMSALKAIKNDEIYEIVNRRYKVILSKDKINLRVSILLDEEGNIPPLTELLDNLDKINKRGYVLTKYVTIGNNESMDLFFINVGNCYSINALAVKDLTNSIDLTGSLDKLEGHILCLGHVFEVSPEHYSEEDFYRCYAFKYTAGTGESIDVVLADAGNQYFSFVEIMKK